ncbi:hypothetical protein FA13DRAFT_1139836 [Coprinellus micaceus]|uniref:Uncharacterized protein n=1 Tax=Coprinellus micaceus TaxID=71717 RepID=A0A4Y7SVP1_COPMI|nr:hypothetical protein FA13DRAFT_1139836 [Coprinellus micaceus]
MAGTFVQNHDEDVQDRDEEDDEEDVRRRRDKETWCTVRSYERGGMRRQQQGRAWKREEGGYAYAYAFGEERRAGYAFIHPSIHPNRTRTITQYPFTRKPSRREGGGVTCGRVGCTETTGGAQDPHIHSSNALSDIHRSSFIVTTTTIIDTPGVGRRRHGHRPARSPMGTSTRRIASGYTPNRGRHTHNTDIGTHSSPTSTPEQRRCRHRHRHQSGKAERRRHRRRRDVQMGIRQIGGAQVPPIHPSIHSPLNQSHQDSQCDSFSVAESVSMGIERSGCPGRRVRCGARGRQDTARRDVYIDGSSAYGR